MKTLHVPFGFNMINVGNLKTLYTGKIRIKTNSSVIFTTTDIKVETTRTGYTLLSWCTDNWDHHNNCMIETNRIIGQAIVRRTKDKYGLGSDLTGLVDDLPF